MTNVKFSRKEFEKHVKLTDEVVKKISLFGTPLEKIDNEEVEVEIFPNRPDLISLQGFMRSFKAFLGRDAGLKKYNLLKPKENFQVKIAPSVKEVRPFTTCAVVKNLKFDDEKIKEIIDLQEKLHFTVGRNRKKVAIGIYPLDKIKLPIKYEARKPKEIRFIPLGEEKEMDGLEILQKHPTGKEFAYLLEKEEKYPIFCDSAGKILSMPPVINSEETGKVTLETRDVFIECSGKEFEILRKVLNIIVTTLADMGGQICQMELDYSGKKIVTPNMAPDKMKIKVENVNKLIGLQLKEKDIAKLLLRMGHDYKAGKAFVPAWRTDILHEVDMIEDVAIAYGYNLLEAEIPKVSTIGEEFYEDKIKNKIAEVLVGLEMLEVLNYHLIKKSEAELMKYKDKIEVENSKTDYKVLRGDLFTPLMRILSENKDNEYPQNIFEMGTIFSKDTEGKRETGIIESENLCVVLSPGNFTKAKGVLDYLFYIFGISYSINEVFHEGLIEGRTCEIRVKDSAIGYIGETHPETLRKWGIKMPVAVFEISLEKVFDIFKKSSD